MSQHCEDVAMADVDSATMQLPALARMPLELMEQITWQLDCEDAKNFYHAVKFSSKHMAATRHIISRLSTADYIDSNLGDSRLILGSMSENLVYISGSGALEYFKPGVRRPQSDWDFYAPNNLALVSAFMEDMEMVGVKWRSPLDQVTKYMDETGGKVRMQREALIQVLEDNTLFEAVSARKYRLRAIILDSEFRDLVGTFDDMREFLDFVLQNEDIPFFGIDIDDRIKVINISTGITLEDYDDILFIKRVIRGELQRGRRTMEIQLMVEAREHPFDTASVFRFHSSAVQCFISAHVACHYYGKSALKGITYAWNDYIVTEKNERALQKYIDRGFCEAQINSTQKQVNCRFGDGEQAIFFGGFRYTEREDWVVRAVVMHARTTFWRETTQKTTLVKSPLGDLRKAWTLNYMNDLNVSGHTQIRSPHVVAQQWAVGRRSKSVQSSTDLDVHIPAIYD